jgi:hypothetical protein
MRIVMSGEVEKIGGQVIRVYLKVGYYPGIFLEGLRKTTINLGQDNRHLPNKARSISA